MNTRSIQFSNMMSMLYDDMRLHGKPRRIDHRNGDQVYTFTLRKRGLVKAERGQIEYVCEGNRVTRTQRGLLSSGITLVAEK